MLRRAIEENSDGTGIARFAFIMTAFTDELADEFKDMDELKLRVHLFQCGEMISWIGHGDNTRLPDAIRPFAELIKPSPELTTAETNERSPVTVDSAAR